MPVSANFIAFDTIIEITIYENNGSQNTENIIDECKNICTYYENLFSRTTSSSEISQLNENKKINASEDVIKILEEAVNIANISDGIVDPTIGSLVSLWNIGKDDFSIPDAESINEELSHINYKNIEINENNNTIELKDTKTQVDLGFIAKGYIADKLKEYLLKNNISSALINLGGNILVVGNKISGGEKTNFNIGINNPQDKNTPLLIIPASDSIKGHQSVVSSGNYERYSEINGVKYHHILSTVDGYPVGINKNGQLDNDLSQVTIISSSSLVGDELSTLCFILGYEKSIKFLDENFNDVLAVFVDNNNNIKYYPDEKTVTNTN